MQLTQIKFRFAYVLIELRFITMNFVWLGFELGFFAIFQIFIYAKFHPE